MQSHTYSWLDEDFDMNFESQGDTRWTCHWEAVKTVIEELDRIITCLLDLIEDEVPKTFTEAKGLLVSICD